MSKVYSIVMKVRLDCPSCHKKITKALCSVCICDLETKSFDEKENTVTITGTFDPEKFMKKIRRKVGKFILSYEVNEINVKKEEKGGPKKEKPAKGEKDPASAPAEDKKKAKNDDKDDKKKGDDKALDPAPEKSVEKPAPKPAAAAAVIEGPVATELYAVPAIGAPASWGYYGQHPYGYYSKHAMASMRGHHAHVAAATGKTTMASKAGSSARRNPRAGSCRKIWIKQRLWSELKI